MRNSIHYNEINEAINCKSSVKNNIVIGMGATMFVGSDRYPMVVTEVISKNKIRVSHMHDDDYERNKRTDENGIDFIPNEFMYKYVRINNERTNIVPMGDVFSLRKNGRWIKEGHGLWETGAIHLGHADEYRDPSF